MTDQNLTTKWQPIETAKGGRVLLWDGTVRLATYRPPGIWAVDWWKEDDGTERFLVVKNPTHWMPLPEPPNAE